MANEYKLTRTDKQQWLRNTGVFFIPVALIYLFSVQSNFVDGFSAEDLYITQVVMGSIMTYIVSTLIDLLKKWLQAS